MKILGIVLIVFLTVLNTLLFWPANLFFLNDDFVHIPLTEKGVFFQTNSIRPVHELLVLFDLWCWGRWAPGYHITSLVLHFIVTFQVYKFSKALAEKELGSKVDYAQQTAILAVILFLSYAGYSESLAWIIGRGPILSAIFLLFTLQLLLRTPEKPGFMAKVAGCLTFACALFAYEQALLVPPVLWLLAMVFNRPWSKPGAKYALALTGVSGIYLIARQVQTAEIMGVYEAGNFRNFNLAVLVPNAGRFVTRLFLNPSDRSTYLVASIVLTLLLGSAILLVTNKVKPFKRQLFFCAGMVIALLAPMLSLGISTNSFESGRFLYLPAIFLVLLFSHPAVYLMRSSGFPRMATTVVLFCLVGYWLNGKWKASSAYAAASHYALNSHAEVVEHFSRQSSEYIVDTLFQNYRGLPVFRSGFKEGISWLYPRIDTSKIKVLNLANQ